jgi:hypothetical protein
MRTDNLHQYITLHRQLTQERDQLSLRLAALDEAIGHLPAQTRSAPSATPVMGTAGTVNAIKRSMSPAARARIAEAQRTRWAAAGGTGAAKQDATKPTTGKRQMSPAARKKIAEAARKRWAAAKRAGKNRL